MSRRRIDLLAAVGLFFGASASISSCLLPGIDPVGAGGGSGAAPGAGGGGAVGGGGPPPGCDDESDCPTETCHAASCEDGVCAYEPTPNLPAGEQTSGDCMVNVCDDGGRIVPIEDGADVPDEPPPSCLSWSCNAGVLEVVAGSDCTDCCGEEDQLDCSSGNCVGCVVASDCGAGGPCFNWSCPAGTCVQQATGPTCGGPTCTQLGVASAEQAMSVCNGFVCQTQTTPCGNYTCNETVCHEQCSSIGADEACQFGNDCKGMACDDCATCQEAATLGVANACPSSVIKIQAVVECFCETDLPAVCAKACATSCDSSVVTDGCFLCLMGATGCDLERNQCTAESDPVP